jgi:Trypsin-like peptidase domain
MNAIIAYHAAMALPKKTLYQILGVPPDASSIDIGLAHEKRVAELANTVPPDPSAAALVQQAYEILSNQHRRTAYDAQLVTAAEKLAAQSQATDLELEPEETDDDERKRKTRLMAMIGGMALVLVALFFVFRPRAPAPPPPEPVVEAPKPPPPKLRTGADVLFNFNTAGGQILSYSMSGSAHPVGVALEVELGQMITTCHALPAGEKLVVKVAGKMQAAELTIVDEQLDLCRLLVPGFTTPPLKVAAEDAKAGDKVFSIGMNAKGEFVATEGTVTQVRTTPLGKVLEVSMPIAPNGSGGGIFNELGQLVGIATAPHKFGQGLNIALPVSWIAQMRSRTTAPTT